MNLLQARVPKRLARPTIAESSIRQETGCTIIAIQEGDAQHIKPDPGMVLPASA
ncbi:hypothetical protein [Pontibacter pamirensis]|uniref:hypothetical protein n=1 Tax=Pontibacter pamirensis TaxID=2562824 RepID=UPI0013899130|nr:hypothetical protein [Pontibacter pamirensis]